jgi:squalene-hopene/tetraprenyl-beta-curcumene cyclase
MAIIESSQIQPRQKKGIKNKSKKKTIPSHDLPVREKTALFTIESLKESIAKSREHILSLQNAKGYWVFALEADTTIPSEYILLQRFLGREIAPEVKDRLANYLRRRQLQDGGWPLYTGGTTDISASVKSYFALKLVGDYPEAPHMVKARQRILSLGGAEKTNVFTRITLALFGQIPWHTTPAMPIEIMLLPKWFFFNLNKISYWSRTVIVPLLLIFSKRPVCSLNPKEGVGELFIEPPEKLRHLDQFVPGKFRKNLFILLDRILKMTDRFMPDATRKKATQLAEQWTIKRMQGKGGIGGIFPAMANAVMALKLMGYPDDHPDFARGMKALDDLILIQGDEALCQPCHSPIWDTSLSLIALLEAELSLDHHAVTTSINWLFKQQIFVRGDWSFSAPNLEPGGWTFQFENSFYPDLDDTSMVLISMFRAGILKKNRYQEKIAKAVNWVIGMQGSDGGWASFDIDNNRLYLNDIPYADHGALVDPSTSDVTARCIELLSMMGYSREFPPIARALQFLRKEQDKCGAWFGRWGVNYIYGTWSVLMALRNVGEDMSQPYIRKAVAWIKSCQNPDNGWGESCATYNDRSLSGKGESTASQTAWALLGLIVAGEENSSEVQGGIQFLLSTQNNDGGWDENLFTGTGFPKAFYLRYHGYSQYFPLWTLGVFWRLRTGGKTLLQPEMRLQSPANFSGNLLK